MRRLPFLAAALVAAGALCLPALHAEEAPPTAPKAPSESAPPCGGCHGSAQASSTKTPTPMHSLMAFVAQQVGPEVGCPCPSTPEGERMWRGWFGGGADVPMAALRDRLVADGWTADRFVGFFRELSGKASACEQGACEKGACEKGACGQGGCEKGACDKAGKGVGGAAGATGAPAAKPSADAASPSKPCCGGESCPQGGCEKGGCEKGACEKSGGCPKGSCPGTCPSGTPAPTKP
ncbi:MAG: hypothetical protein ACKOSS_04000 [Planctomycetia bacterium]